MEYCKLKDIATIYNGNSINKTVKKQTSHRDTLYQTTNTHRQAAAKL